MMKHTLKAGFTRSDTRIYAQWDGDELCSLETAADLPNFRLSVIDQEKQKHLVTLRGAFAARLLCILDERLRDVRDSDFNCFAAVDTVAEGASIRGDIHWREPLPFTGDRYRELEPPYRIQVEGPYSIPTGDGDWRETHGVVHEGIVLTQIREDEALVFHKPGPLRPHLSDVPSMLLGYRRYMRLRYGPLL